MGKIKTILQNPSLKTAFFLYTMAALIAALLLSFSSSAFCDYTLQSLYHKYETQYKVEEGKAGEIILEDGQKVNSSLIFYTNDITAYFTGQELFFYQFLHLLKILLVPVWFLVCAVAATVLFYKSKLKKPLAILDSAAEKIAQNDLDFSVQYHRSDEMGRLCSSFEKMRLALQENSLEMWQQMDGRKQLNAAFSHDLRTPLTVLKGQSDMLLKYIPDGRLPPEKVLAIIVTMKTHITRLEDYVNMMNKLQKLEDIEIQKTEVPADGLMNLLKESASVLCAEKQIKFDNTLLGKRNLHIDPAIVLQVYENLLSNALRYAQNTVSVTVSYRESLSISVADDGKGFSKKDLAYGTNPFYKSEKKEDSHHFGMGLNICKILCEKHGGSIQLQNNTEGGAKVTAMF